MCFHLSISDYESLITFKAGMVARASQVLLYRHGSDTILRSASRFPQQDLHVPGLAEQSRWVYALAEHDSIIIS